MLINIKIHFAQIFEEDHLSIAEITDQWSSCLGWRGWEELGVRQWVSERKVIVVLESIMICLRAHAIIMITHAKLLIWLVL